MPSGYHGRAEPEPEPEPAGAAGARLPTAGRRRSGASLSRRLQTISARVSSAPALIKDGRRCQTCQMFIESDTPAER